MDVEISRVLGKDAKYALNFGDVGIITYNNEYVCTWCSDYFKEHDIDLLNKKLTSWIENMRSLFEDEADSIIGVSNNQVYEIEKRRFTDFVCSKYYRNYKSEKGTVFARNGCRNSDSR